MCVHHSMSYRKPYTPCYHTAAYTFKQQQVLSIYECVSNVNNITIATIGMFSVRNIFPFSFFHLLRTLYHTHIYRQVE